MTIRFWFAAILSGTIILFTLSAGAETHYVGMKAGKGNVKRGEYLFNQVGFGAGRSGKSCATCHPGGKGMEGVAKKFAGRDAALRKAVNRCIRGALKGKGIREDSQAMADITAYMRSLGK